MFVMLKNYLSEVLTPQATDVYVRAAKTLSGYGYIEFEAHIGDLLQLTGGHDETHIITSIEGVLLKSYYNLLDSFGVYLNSADVVQMTEYVDALMGLTNYGDPQAILDIIQSTDDSNEAFAEILSLISPYTTEDILLTVDEVSPMLINQIHEEMEQLEENLSTEIIGDITDATGEFLNIVRKRLHAYMYLPGNSDLLIGQAIANGMRVFLDFDSYISQANADLIKIHDVSQLAREVLAMALASNTPNDEVVDTAVDCLPEFIVDMVTLSRGENVIRSEFSQVMQGIDQ